MFPRRTVFTLIWAWLLIGLFVLPVHFHSFHHIHRFGR